MQVEHVIQPYLKGSQLSFKILLVLSEPYEVIRDPLTAGTLTISYYGIGAPDRRES